MLLFMEVGSVPIIDLEWAVKSLPSPLQLLFNTSLCGPLQRKDYVPIQYTFIFPMAVKIFRRSEFIPDDHYFSTFLFN